MSQLSRRSYDSTAHEKRVSKYRVTDDDLFDYVLRVAILSHVTSSKITDAPVKVAETKEKDHHYKLSGAISYSIVSIGDIFKEIGGGSKSVKFPEKLLKVLEQKLQSIVMGRDQAYSDQLTRRTIAVFYNHFMGDGFRKQMKENRSIEELILMFAAQSTGVLKKEPTLVDDAWKVELNNQIAQFVKMLRECLKGLSHVSPELNSRLDMYQTKLSPPLSHESGHASTSVIRDRGDSVSTVQTANTSVQDMSLVMTVAKLFRIPEQAMQSEVDRLRKICTEKAALIDLKTCLKNINAGAAFPGRREDFPSEAAWTHWRTLETSHLSQLMVAMVSTNPELAKSMPSDEAYTSTRPSSVYSTTRADLPATTIRHVSSASTSSHRSVTGVVGGDGFSEDVEEDGEIRVGHHFTFIPPNPRRFYKRLVEHCITAELELLYSPEVDDADEIPLTILSQPHVQLINECAVRWRIGKSYRATCFLEVIKQFYERSEVPMDCVPAALQAVTESLHDLEIDKWSIQDAELLASVYGGLYNIFLSSLYHAMESLPNVKVSEIQPYLSVLDHIRESGLMGQFEADINSRLLDLEDRIRDISAQYYQDKMQQLQSSPGVNQALPLLLMTDDMEKAAKQLDKRFPEPLVGRIDLVSLVVEVQVPLFIADLQKSGKKLLESSTNGPTPDVPIQDIFSLYRRTKTLLEMLRAFCPQSQVQFDLGQFFMQYVLRWLSETDSKTGQWVQAAIVADKFQAENADGHSSSIVDLFDSLRSPIAFLQELEWSDEYQNARFFTSLSKTISKAVEQYCRNVEEMFMTEMFPRTTEYLQPQKSSAWLEKAKQLATTGEKKVEPFNFQPESCVKLNNVEAARKLLDNLYSQMQVDKITDVLATSPPVPEKVERSRFLFTVKIVMAENLVPLDSSPSSLLDTFVTLSDEAGNRLVKTRTIYESVNPRWEETFDISVDKPLWLMCSIRDRALMGQHDVVGRSFICLNPSQYGDYLTHDVWLSLESANQSSESRILLRISMEGETDDAQFYFGRAFRSLKRSEGDMMRIFIDKMSPFIRQSISRIVVKSLMKGGSSGLDYNRALANMTGLYRSALGSSSSEVQIPLPSSEKSRVRPEELSDVEIERAIVPLFDYFDANLQILNTHLSETAKEMVMLRVWKEILTVIEGLLIPPLSKLPSDMKPLSDREVDIVFKWLKFLRDYFYANGEGIPLEALQNQKYRDVLSIRLYYDWHTDTLMEECVRAMQQSLREAVPVKKRVKTVYNQRNLGTIKERKKEKKQEKEMTSGEVILRILRMRSNTSEFIAQQLEMMANIRTQQERSQVAKLQRKTQSSRQAAPSQSSIALHDTQSRH
ncbi:hypothetical protein PISMIDRAFT_97293 [Pisolithus microcarpus 441]|uniref:Uncharacterized protein n=1 Tax=Pisolithus microcarpus 441 TaxID=765257 RepID=A0A0C9YJW5_9AGAM|nr:hypothetical protein PISMIDRAFT_97293 [Pisolithus microcarpus 441]